MNQFLKSVLLIVAGLAFISCDTPVSDCANGVILPLQVQINDCEESPCELVRGSTAVLNVTFRAPYYIEGLTPEVIATALGLDVNYPLSETNGCNSLLNLRCPIDEGELIRYQLQMPILAFYPTISLEMQFSIYDENNDGLVCFGVSARVVAASK